MHLSSELEFEAEPGVVFEMLADPDFQSRVGAAASALTCEVSSAGDEVTLRLEFNAPPGAVALSGPTISLVQVLHWGPKDAQGDRVARMELRSPGLPVAADGTVRLFAGGRTTRLSYQAELTVAVPLLGPSLEAKAAPLFEKAIAVQQGVGEDWLRERLSR